MALNVRDRPTSLCRRRAGPARATQGGIRVIGVAVVVTAVLAMTAALVFVGGFLWFVSTRADRGGRVAARRRRDRRAHRWRVAHRGRGRALAAGHGKRLLITGVHRATSSDEIARVMPRHERLLKCCVDLDHSAVNTVGNAAGTRRWARNLRFGSLIVVTSSYHMPRTMAELGRQLPDVTLIPFPVVSDTLRAGPWWDSLPTAKLLFSEYLKYMLAQVRMRLEPTSDTTDVAGARGRIGS